MSKFGEFLSIIKETDIPLSFSFDPTPTHAMTEFIEGEFVIAINPKYKRHTEVLLLHALSHILDGDLSPNARVSYPNIKLHSMAADALINRDLLKKTTPKDQEFIRDACFTFDNLVKKYPDLNPDMYHDRKSLYDELERRANQDSNQNQDQEQYIDFQPAKLDDEDQYTRALEKASKGLQGILIPKPKYEQDDSLVLNKKLVNRSAREFKRSWRRPGVLPFLRGTTRIRTERIGFALDVSGSYEDEWDRIYSQALSWIKNRVNSIDTFILGVFSDTCETYRGDRSSPIFGGGTYIKPVYQWAEENQLDRLVILTDGDYYDSDTKKPNNIIVEEIKPSKHTSSN